MGGKRLLVDGQIRVGGRAGGRKGGQGGTYLEESLGDEGRGNVSSRTLVRVVNSNI